MKKPRRSHLPHIVRRRHLSALQLLTTLLLLEQLLLSLRDIAIHPSLYEPSDSGYRPHLVAWYPLSSWQVLKCAALLLLLFLPLLLLSIPHDAILRVLPEVPDSRYGSHIVCRSHLHSTVAHQQ